MDQIDRVGANYFSKKFSNKQASEQTKQTIKTNKTISENFSKHFAAIEINELLAWETKSASLSRSNWLDRMKSVACSNAANLHSSTASDIKKLTSISQYMPTSLTTCSEDTVLIKINHGFWEQIYLIINDGYDPIIMRPTAKLGYQESYLNSRFLDALLFFSRKHASVENSILKFNLIDFGFSYNNGDFWNNEIFCNNFYTILKFRKFSVITNVPTNTLIKRYDISYPNK